MASERNESLDILKGIGILLVIIAHTFGMGHLWDIIYVFHMPLFFLVSGYFFKIRPFKEHLKKDFRRLIVPYLFVCLLTIFYSFCKEYLHNTPVLYKSFISIFYGNGPIWFLLGLFFSRLLFYFLLKNIRFYLIIAFIISSITLLYKAQLQILPLALLPALGCVLFLAIGYTLNINKTLSYLNNKYPIQSLIIGFIFWSISATYGKVEVVNCTFNLWILDYLGALGGTYVIFRLSCLIDKSNNRIKNFFVYTGIYSIVIFCIHSFETSLNLWYLFQPYFSVNLFILFILICRLLIAYSFVYVSRQFKILRYIFCIK